MEFDKLQLYFAMPYVVDVEGAEGTITIKQPTVRDLVEKGEEKFFSNLNIFVANTTTYRLALWEVGIDWNEISNFELFCMLYTTIDDWFSQLLFGEDFSFAKFQIYEKTISEEETYIVLYSEELNIEINEAVYKQINGYLQYIFKFFPEEKTTKDKILKKWFINKDKKDLEILQKKVKDKEKETSIVSLISSCVNHAGFKYNSKQILDIGICEFYDSIQRLQVYESTTAVMKGMFSGFVDTSKIKPDEYNFMKEI